MHMHHHSEELNLDPQIRRKARIVLSAVIVPLLIATLIGLLVLFPGGRSKIGVVPAAAKGVTQARGIVIDKPASQCLLAGGQIDGDLLQSAVCAQITKGEGSGLVVPVHLPPEYQATVVAGTKVKLLYDPNAITAGTPYLFWDIERTLPIGLLALLYFFLVVGVAGKRGFAALVGLLLSSLVIIFFVVPALMAGESPMLVTLVGASAMMFLSVYMAHGVTIRTTTALIGTFLGLALTTLLAMYGVHEAGLTGASSEDALNLMTYFPKISLTAMLTCGIVIAGLGALNDVTITQASAVWELHEANPRMTKWHLFQRAMRIGRDHIASTVYTLAFAYAGTALPTLILAFMIDRPALDLLMSADISEEIVRTLVASIGLVLAIPATTFVGVMLVKWIQKDDAPSTSSAAAKPATAKAVQARAAINAGSATETFMTKPQSPLTRPSAGHTRANTSQSSDQQPVNEQRAKRPTRAQRRHHKTRTDHTE
ncbi:MAG: YibE/F family protein [Actinomycetaceae bacterium]|nr:YibE/F family protein [Actinomycetaceae bacterium]